MSIKFYLAKILGRRAALAFGVVTLLIAGLLAAINVASRHALKLYIEDQLSRLSWDVALYQTTEFAVSKEITPRLRAVNGVERVESLTFLRSKPPPEAALQVDRKPLASPWVSILAATDLSLLPSEVRPKAGDSGAHLALVGPEQQMGHAFLALQGAKNFSVIVHSHGKKGEAELFDLPVRGVVRLERAEVNRYFMDEIGTISFVPYIGVILVMPHDFERLRWFDALSRGALGGSVDIHATAGEYLPEVIHLARVDRKKLISGWDIRGSLANLKKLQTEIEAQVSSLGPTIFVDNAILVLLNRMAEISRLLYFATLLIAIPLLAIAWMLASNLSALLILNERRKLGLMRLRGVPGALLGQSLLLSIGAGGLIGGVIGLVLGTLLPLALYERGALSWTVLGHVQGPLQMLLFLVVGLVFALWSSRKLVRYATTISPLEASRRVAPSESMQAAMRFGPLQLAALLIGLYKLASWAADFDPARRFPLAEDASAYGIFFIKSLFMLDRALDFVALPLVVYGIVTLFVSRRSLMTALLAAVSRLLGGPLRRLSLSHMSFKPHRIASFLLIVALMASVSLYPSIGARSFEDKALRGATVEVGSELHIALGPGDLVPAEKLDQGLGAQAQALRAAVKERLAGVRDDNIVSVDTIVEALLPGFFFPGYGLSGVPLYLIDDPERYLQTVFYDEKLGVGGNFSGIVRDLKTEKVAASPPVAAFWNLAAGDPILLGPDVEKKPVLVPGGGVIGFLPGMPPRSIADRQSFVSARIDYLNYLSSNDAYLVATADNPKIADLKVLVPRVLLLVRLKREQGADAAVQEIAGAFKARPLEVRVLGRELKKIGGDMFIFLALENMRIYLVGGMLLALIAIAAIALTNYLEDRRTLGLLRVRGASPALMFKFFASMLLAPALAGLMIGVVIAAIAGFGLTNLIWDLREIKSVVHLLPTHLVLSGATVWIGAGLFVVIGGIALLFSLLVFRRSARERMLE
jgi:hypothetical protein